MKFCSNNFLEQVSKTLSNISLIFYWNAHVAIQLDDIKYNKFRNIFKVSYFKKNF